MRTSENTTPLFVDVLPDWSKGVKIEAVHDTMLFTSRAVLEQRQRTRFDARYRITFQRCGYTRAEWAARWARLRDEYRNVCIVPFWTEGSDAVRMYDNRTLSVADDARLLVGDGSFLSIGQSAYRMPFPLRAEWWKPGRYAYLFDGVAGQFQEIISASSDETGYVRANAALGRVRGFIRRRARARISLMPAANDALGNFDTARIFPCVPCRRVMDQGDQAGESVESYDETMIFETL